MSIKSSALAAKSTTLVYETTLTIILGDAGVPVPAVAAATALGGGRRTGPLSTSATGRDGPPYSARPLSERSNSPAGAPGARTTPADARTAPDARMIQLG